MGDCEYGININNKFANLDEDVDPSVLLERAMKEKKERVKQAKQAAKKGEAPAPVVQQPAKPVKEQTKEKRTDGPRRTNKPDGACHNCGTVGHLARECPEEKKPREKPTGERRPKREGRQNNGEPREQRERKPPGNCFNCGGEGHLSRDCTEEKKPREKPVRPPQECFSCGGTGHLSRECPERKPKEKKCYNCNQNGHISKECPEARQTTDENAVPKAEKPANTEDQPQDENAEGTTEQVPEDNEPPKLTLAEWKAQQKQEKAVFNTRQAERNDKNLEKFEVLKREGDKSADESYEYEEIEVQSKRAQHTKVLDIDVNFLNANRGPARPERRPQQGARPGNNTRPSNAGPSTAGRRRLNLASDFPALA